MEPCLELAIVPVVVAMRHGLVQMLRGPWHPVGTAMREKPRNHVVGRKLDLRLSTPPEVRRGMASRSVRIAAEINFVKSVRGDYHTRRNPRPDTRRGPSTARVACTAWSREPCRRRSS